VILLGSGQDLPGDSLVPARLTQPGDQRFEFTVDLSRSGYFVLADSYVPGWWARVNGAPVRILPANSLVRAVAIPAGTSRIAFLISALGIPPRSLGQPGDFGRYPDRCYGLSQGKDSELSSKRLKPAENRGILWSRGLYANL